jgi:3-hydroxymyristoyl/3-hydroxydecanoyl-(acyl carrier protein) dehydratase
MNRHVGIPEGAGDRRDGEPLPTPPELLPHRYPFLLLDAIEAYHAGELQAVKCVTCNEPYFQGHFPGLAIVPGVLLIEMMAQACAALARLDRGRTEHQPPRPGRIAAIEKARFRREVRPGERLLIETRLTHRVGTLNRFEARIRCNDEPLAECILTLTSPEHEVVVAGRRNH